VKVNLTTERKPASGRVEAPEVYVGYVAAAIGDALPLLFRWASGERDLIDELAIDSRLADIEHAARMARERIAQI
jgi:hypothetical protein